MQYVLAFVIFVIVIYVIGVLFSFLWPLLVALVIIAALGNLIAYHRRKKAWKDLYENTEPFRQNSYDHPYQGTRSGNDDVIDVEYSETTVDDDK